MTETAAKSTCWQDRRLFGLAAVLLGVPLLSGQMLTRWDYAVTRNVRAQQVIDALAAHYEDESIYPDELTELVAARRLERVPAPRIGFGPFAGFVTLSVATVGFFAKLLAEDIEDMDWRQAEAVRATGAS